MRSGTAEVLETSQEDEEEQKAKKRKKTQEKALEKIQLQKEIEEEIERQKEQSITGSYDSDIEEQMEGATLLQHAMGMKGDAFTLSQEVEVDDDEYEIENGQQVLDPTSEDLSELDMDEEALKYIDVVDN